MYDSYVIETRKGAAGIVVRDGRGFRFFAASRHFIGLEGHMFTTPKEAETAAVRHLAAAKARATPGAKAERRLDHAMEWSS